MRGYVRCFFTACAMVEREHIWCLYQKGVCRVTTAHYTLNPFSPAPRSRRGTCKASRSVSQMCGMVQACAFLNVGFELLNMK